MKWWRLQLSAFVHRFVRREVTFLLCKSCGQVGRGMPNSSCFGAGVRVSTARIYGRGFGSVVVQRPDNSLCYLPFDEEGTTWARGIDTPAARALLVAEALS